METVSERPQRQTLEVPESLPPCVETARLSTRSVTARIAAVSNSRTRLVPARHTQSDATGPVVSHSRFNRQQNYMPSSPLSFRVGDAAGDAAMFQSPGVDPHTSHLCTPPGLAPRPIAPMRQTLPVAPTPRREGIVVRKQPRNAAASGGAAARISVEKDKMPDVLTAKRSDTGRTSSAVRRTIVVASHSATVVRPKTSSALSQSRGTTGTVVPGRATAGTRHATKSSRGAAATPVQSVPPPSNGGLLQNTEQNAPAVLCQRPTFRSNSFVVPTPRRSGTAAVTIFQSFQKQHQYDIQSDTLPDGLMRPLSLWRYMASVSDFVRSRHGGGSQTQQLCRRRTVSLPPTLASQASSPRTMSQQGAVPRGDTARDARAISKGGPRVRAVPSTSTEEATTPGNGARPSVRPAAKWGAQTMAGAPSSDARRPLLNVPKTSGHRMGREKEKQMGRPSVGTSGMAASPTRRPEPPMPYAGVDARSRRTVAAAGTSTGRRLAITPAPQPLRPYPATGAHARARSAAPRRDDYETPRPHDAADPTIPPDTPEKARRAAAAAAALQQQQQIGRPHHHHHGTRTVVVKPQQPADGSTIPSVVEIRSAFHLVMQSKAETYKRKAIRALGGDETLFNEIYR